MISVPGSEHHVPPTVACDFRGREITLSLYVPQYKENMYDLMLKASYVKIFLTQHPGAKVASAYLGDSFETLRSFTDSHESWEKIEPTKANLQRLLAVPWTTDKSKNEEELAVWTAKPSSQLCMWENTDNERVRLVCLEDAARTVIESGHMKSQSCISWLRNERWRAGFGWDSNHRAQFEYLPEGQSEGVSTEMIAPTIGPISEYKKWK